MFDNLLNDVKVITKELPMMPPWGVMTSIFGGPSSWTKSPHSEFYMYKDVPETLHTMAHIAVHRTFPLREEPCSIPREEEHHFRDEAWFFINGITTSVPMLKRNGAFFKELFKRPLELISNPTDGIFIDIFECLFGRTFDMTSKPAMYARKRIEDALTSDDIKKVVVLAHSQGGIVASNVVKWLIDEHKGDARLKKLEVYTFGCAADEFEIDHELSVQAKRLVPYIEHYANLGDLVARVGVLQKRQQEPGHYFGEIYEFEKEGHYLNAHYLPEFQDKSYFSRRVGKRSRLYEYLKGGIPKYFNPLPVAGV